MLWEKLWLRESHIDKLGLTAKPNHWGQTVLTMFPLQFLEFIVS